MQREIMKYLIIAMLFVGCAGNEIDLSKPKTDTLMQTMDRQIEFSKHLLSVQDSLLMQAKWLSRSIDLLGEPGYYAARDSMNKYTLAKTRAKLGIKIKQ
jgi:hypothetical protein